MSTGTTTTTTILSSNRRMFAVLGQTNLEQLGQAIQAQYPEDHYALGNGQWLLVSEGTAKGVSDKLGIAEGLASAVIVLFH